MEENKITKDMTIADIIKKNPKSAGILLSYGMHCLGCVISQGETLEQAADVHGISIDQLLEALNNG